MTSLVSDLENLNISDKTSIFCFARMNPPHKGHGKLITSMLAIRNSLKKHGIQAHVHIILQKAVDPEKNPLTFDQRERFIWNYINYGPNLEDEDKQYIHIRVSTTSQYAFQQLHDEGFNKFYFLMGTDRREGFTSPDFDRYEPNMHNKVKSLGINWNKLPPSTEGNNWDNENKFFKKGKYPYELQLIEFEKDHILSNYTNMEFPIIDKNSIISIINPRPKKVYQFIELGEREKERDPKTLSATDIRKKIRQVPLTTFTGRSIEDIESNNNFESYEGSKANADFRGLVKNLMLQGERGNPKESKALTFKMIWTIKHQMFPGREHSIIGYGSRDPLPSRTRRNSLSRKKKSPNNINMKSINVLSYNTSWEATQPAIDWMKKHNLYGPPNRENGIGHLCGRRELYDNITKSGPFEIGVLKKGEKNKCVENIFDIIQSGNYDLVGMQEYVHNWPFGEDDHPVFSKKMKELNHMELVKHELRHRRIKKDIEIGSLFNTNRFNLLHSELGEFKIELFNHAEGKVKKGLDDGRPVQALLLNDLITKKYIIFLNAHFPQPRGISVKGSHEDRAAYVNKIMTELVKKLINKSGANNAAVNNNNEIILAADTNDGALDFLKYIEINGKKMHLGSGLHKKNTCCTPLVKDLKMKSEGYSLPPAWGKRFITNKDGKQIRNPKWGKSYVKWEKGKTFKRDDLRKRKGDVIMYSRDNDFEYQFPEEKKDEPYSDHAPIAAILTAPAQLVGGKKRTRKKRKRRRKRTKKKKRKKRRRKRTKKKRRKR